MAPTAVPVNAQPNIPVLVYPPIIPNCPISPVSFILGVRYKLQIFKSADKWSFATGAIDPTNGESLIIPYVTKTSSALTIPNDPFRNWQILTIGVTGPGTTGGPTDPTTAKYFPAKTVVITDDTGPVKYRHRDLTVPCDNQMDPSFVADLSNNMQDGMFLQITLPGTSTKINYLWKKVVDLGDSDAPANFFLQQPV